MRDHQHVICCTSAADSIMRPQPARIADRAYVHAARVTATHEHAHISPCGLRTSKTPPSSELRPLCPKGASSARQAACAPCSLLTCTRAVCACREDTMVRSVWLRRGCRMLHELGRVQGRPQRPAPDEQDPHHHVHVHHHAHQHVSMIHEHRHRAGHTGPHRMRETAIDASCASMSS